MKNIFQDLRRKDHKRYLGGLDVFKYIGPGLLVTVGFIDPGNWASNFAAGSEFGYSLLWVVTLSTIMLIVLQHNAAHLGIVTGIVPVRGSKPLHKQDIEECDSCNGSSRCHCDCDGRDFRRCHCTADAVPHSD